MLRILISYEIGDRDFDEFILQIPMGVLRLEWKMALQH
jgi:hypothetical protein